jgi:Fe2+ or Zn2+ uptake regulation protein
MKKSGLVRELSIDGMDYRRYDPIVSPHHHLVCSDCGKIEDVQPPFSIDVPKEQKQGFDIQTGEIIFYGLCPVCKNKNK